MGPFGDGSQLLTGDPVRCGHGNRGPSITQAVQESSCLVRELGDVMREIDRGLETVYCDIPFMVPKTVSAFK